MAYSSRVRFEFNVGEVSALRGGASYRVLLYNNIAGICFGLISVASLLLFSVCVVI